MPDLQDAVHRFILQRAYPHTQWDPVTRVWTAAECRPDTTILWTLGPETTQGVRSVFTLPKFGIYAK